MGGDEGTTLYASGTYAGEFAELNNFGLRVVEIVTYS